MAPHNHQVLIGYTYRLFSNGLEALMESFDNFSLFGSALVGDHLTSALGTNGSLDFLILEMDLPGERDLGYIGSLAKSFTSLKILLISHLPNKQMTSKLLESGISGYLLKSCSRQDLLTALHKMSEDKPYFCSDITKTLLASNNSHQDPEENILTERETEILALLVQSHTNRYIAENLSISENTVKTHRRNIHKKFGVSNLLGMVRYACRENLVDFGCEEFCKSCHYVN
jgi:DNA-binding NarL/FixJ family response regulator